VLFETGCSNLVAVVLAAQYKHLGKQIQQQQQQQQPSSCNIA
jgi:hypothetical protein